MVFRQAVAALAMGLVVTACGGAAPKPPFPASSLDGVLLAARDINKVMGTAAMTPNDPFTAMSDHRNLLPNINCLAIWEVGEKAVYGGSGWTAIRGQLLRQPNTDNWDALVIQAAVVFPSADSAQAFYRTSSDRWSKCSSHRVNITRNDGPPITLSFGALTNTGTELTMPFTRNNDRSCQRAFTVTNNVAIDVAACATAITTQAATIADAMKSRLTA